jgi:2,3-bisphosphoglycerate-independent phosphoglycerate mutase
MDFDEFPVLDNLNLRFATLIEYQKNLPVLVAFPPEANLEDTLSAVIARAGKRQLKITEAEKSFHVSYFWNGKREAPFPGEDRIVVPSRKDVANFSLAPEMSLAGIIATLSEVLATRTYDFILANLSNVDVVSHIDREGPVLAAIAAVDQAAGKIIAAARATGYTVIVTADHGSAEKWYYPDGTIDTGHSDSPVPFLLLGPKNYPLKREGSLIDVAPTVLDLLGLPIPAAMSGSSLITSRLSRPDGRVLLLLLDGWGYREDPWGNLIRKAATPTMDSLYGNQRPTTLLASGAAVGLPPEAVGNSEAGHLHLGAGRLVPSDRMRIDRAIQTGEFFQNQAFLEVMRHVKNQGKALHLLGIISFFSSHGSLAHLLALMEMARREQVAPVYIHALLGRRGELPESGAVYLEKVETEAAKLERCLVVSVIGRYFALDREENWDRVEKAYRMLIQGTGVIAAGGD